jgi:hypothetical protein
MFEPTRLAAEYLADAYAQVAPLRRRSTSTEKTAYLPSGELQRREQV